MQIDALHLPFASGVVLNYGCFCHGKCEITSPTLYEMISNVTRNLCNMPPMHTLLDISADLETCPSSVSQGNGYISLCILIKLKEISSLCMR